VNLTAEAVNEIFFDCLFREEELVDGKPEIEPVMAEGLVNTVGFHRERLEGHREDVTALLGQIDKTFLRSEGGGWSFLNFVQNSEGEMWTGLQRTAEQLVLLGLGLGLVEYLLPRPLWGSLPGGVPYLVINDPAPQEVPHG
jgi:hypothetical protein